MIDNIPVDAFNHEPWKCKKRNEAPKNGKDVARTVTCSGGGQVHPSGRRDYTPREFACLQSFPLEHEFQIIGAKTQIGNAVPPLVGSRLLESVKDALLKEDGLR